MLTHLSLFSGIGGADLAAEWAGFENVGSCDIDEYASRVHAKHWPDVPNFGDIKTLTKETYHEQTGLYSATVISGGFPCQPFSVAGKRRGEKDDRYLWPEMLRVIEELRPTWVIGENVAGFVKIGLDRALSDLETAGYSSRAFVFPACAVGALHQRQRIFIVAHSDGVRCHRRRRAQGDLLHTERDAEGTVKQRDQRLNRSGKVCKAMADSEGQRCQRIGPSGQQVADPRPEAWQPEGCSDGHQWWAVEPDVDRLAHGVSARVDRLRCLGNAIVPQQIYPIFEAIAQIERSAK